MRALDVAVVVYPGSNCDRDMFYALELSGFRPRFVGLKGELRGYPVIAVPGGFSYGDYLRPGAVAAREEISHRIREEAERGALVLGVCNGFQILVEMGLLPGALLQNEDGLFSCRWVDLLVEDASTPFTRCYRPGQRISLPIANGFGRYYRGGGDVRVVMRYVHDVNGSEEGIAAVANEAGNVLGMMPHPERACEEILGGTDGIVLFRSMMEHLSSLL